VKRLLVFWVLASAAPAQNGAGEVRDRIRRALPAGVLHTALGVTRHNTPIPALLGADDLDYETPRVRLLLVGGLDGSAASVQSVLGAIGWFYSSDARRYRSEFTLSAVPVANPDGWLAATSANRSGGNPGRGYPPRGEAYRSPSDPEAAYLWRWIGMHAPDIVLEVRAGGPSGWHFPEAQQPFAALKPVHRLPVSDELVPQLVQAAPAGTGVIPAIQVRVGASGRAGFLQELLVSLRKSRFTEPSAARREIQARLRRTPLEVSRQLAPHYGHELPEPVYIPGMALIGRLRLGELTGDSGHLADVERIVAPYVTGEKPALAKPTGSHLSGHLIFAELAQRTSKPRYLELARAAADLGFDRSGEPRAVMPMHSEMSDAVFMGGPILARVGRLTGEPRYFDMCVRHLRYMVDLNRRRDGLQRHSPLDEAAWGRGNGFVALGLALSLSDLPPAHPGRAELLRDFRAHLEALAAHQDLSGAWRQVIDREESYRELSATCMIAFAMLRGVRAGWIEPARFDPLIARAWSAIKSRVAPDGTLVDVCTGTGKQKNLRDYLDRTAILGRDPRGGAMALLIATEMARTAGR
jgi:rhamnogalacturonyl hydrolase YesR